MFDIGGHAWENKHHSVAADCLEPCVWCRNHPAHSPEGFCGACWWRYRAEVANGFAQLATYLTRQAEFAAYLESHQ